MAKKKIINAEDYTGKVVKKVEEEKKETLEDRVKKLEDLVNRMRYQLGV